MEVRAKKLKQWRNKRRNSSYYLTIVSMQITRARLEWYLKMTWKFQTPIKKDTITLLNWYYLLLLPHLKPLTMLTFKTVLALVCNLLPTFNLYLRVWKNLWILKIPWQMMCWVNIWILKMQEVRKIARSKTKKLFDSIWK